MAAQPLLGCGNDRPDDSDEPPAVFYIESTSQDHQEAPGRDTGTSTTAKSSITQNDFSALPLKELEDTERSSDTINEYMAGTPIDAASALTGRAVPGSTSRESDSVRLSPGASLVDAGRQYEDTEDRRVTAGKEGRAHRHILSGLKSHHGREDT